MSGKNNQEIMEKLTQIRGRVLFGSRMFMLTYLPFTVLQALGFFAFPTKALVNRSTAILSVSINVFLLAVIFVFWFLNDRLRKKEIPAGKRFYISMLTSVSIVLFGMIVHIHLAGSQNSILPLLFIAAMLVVAWFFRRREIRLLLLFGNLALALIVTLEWFGIFDYAPLMANNDQVKEIFLRGPVIAINVLIYLTTLAILSILHVQVRNSLRESADDIREKNEELKKEGVAKQDLIDKLSQALNDVKTLKGLLPICSSCKKIRDDQGYWKKVEDYFYDNKELQFTHSLCPDCMKDIYPEY